MHLGVRDLWRLTTSETTAEIRQKHLSDSHIPILYYMHNTVGLHAFLLRRLTGCNNRKHKQQKNNINKSSITRRNKKIIRDCEKSTIKERKSVDPNHMHSSRNWKKYIVKVNRTLNLPDKIYFSNNDIEYFKQNSFNSFVKYHHNHLSYLKFTWVV